MGNDIYDRYLIAKNKPEDERSEDDWKVIGDWTKTIFDMDNERPAIMRYEGEGVLYINKMEAAEKPRLPWWKRIFGK